METRQANSVPMVSIGMPVYNGETVLAMALDSLLAQSLRNFEIIVSDNASTDSTAEILAAYAARDPRIRCIRQPVNLGATANFKCVLHEARGRYFMWAAADDMRSPDFLEENVRFLDSHPDYVASTSPNCFEGQDPDGPDLVTFALDEGDPAARLYAFLDHCWVSHGIFYALIRTEVIKACTIVGQSFLGADWAIDLYLVRCGPVHRTERGLMVSGAKGLSNSRDAWRVFRTSGLSWIFPFYRVSDYAWNLSMGLPLRQRCQLLCRLLRLNLFAAYNQCYAEFYPAYRTYLRPWRQKLRRNRP